MRPEFEYFPVRNRAGISRIMTILLTDRNVELPARSASEWILWRAFPTLLSADSVPVTPCRATKSAPHECADFVARLGQYTRSAADDQRTLRVDVTIGKRVFSGLLRVEAQLLRLFLSNIDGLLQDV